jgi:hypothetical protein
LASKQGRAIAQAVSRLLPTRRPGFEPKSGHVGFVVDKVAQGQVFSESVPCQFSLLRLLYIHRLSPGAGTVDQLAPSGPSFMPPQLVSSHLICIDELSKDAEENRIPLLLGAFQLRINTG